MRRSRWKRSLRRATISGTGSDFVARRRELDGQRQPVEVVASGGSVVGSSVGRTAVGRRGRGRRRAGDGVVEWVEGLDGELPLTLEPERLTASSSRRGGRGTRRAGEHGDGGHVVE